MKPLITYYIMIFYPKKVVFVELCSSNRKNTHSVH